MPASFLTSLSDTMCEYSIVTERFPELNKSNLIMNGENIVKNNKITK